MNNSKEELRRQKTEIISTRAARIFVSSFFILPSAFPQ